MRVKPQSASPPGIPTPPQEGREAPAHPGRVSVLFIMAPLLAFTLFCLPGHASANGPTSMGPSGAASSGNRHPAPRSLPAPMQSGLASWYGGKTFTGKRTASGEQFRPEDLTAAHRSLPLGTKLLVHVPATGRSVIVRVNDRGPYANNRIIDLSKGAARNLGIIHHGVSRVTLTVLPHGRTRQHHIIRPYPHETSHQQPSPSRQ